MSINEGKLNMSNKATSLNPNAEEFVPSSLRSPHDASKRSDPFRLVDSGSSKEAFADQSESTVPSNSDEEAHQYWQHQLPDDITPDFKVLGQDEPQGPENLSLTGLSINDSVGASIFSPNQALSMKHHASPFSKDRLSIRPKIGFPSPTYVEQSHTNILSPTASIMSPTAAPWVKPIRNGGQYNTNRRDMDHYNADSSSGASLQNLPDAYYGNGNGHNLESTMDILSQLENKADDRLNQNIRALSFGISSPSSPVAYAQNGLMKFDKEASGLPSSLYRSSSAILTDDTVSPSTVREHVSLDAPRWRYRTNNMSIGGLGSSRGSQLLASSYNANMYLEPKEEVRDLANLRNAFVEQERQAYLTGGNPLAKELNLKELYNIQSRLAQEKAREAMYRQRIQMPELQGFIQEQNPPIDLCGLHVNEGIHVLNYELDSRRKIARSTGRRLQVIIISSTRTPARLTAAVEQYLLEHALQYTQSQPGLFRVVLQ